VSDWKPTSAIWIGRARVLRAWNALEWHLDIRHSWCIDNVKRVVSEELPKKDKQTITRYYQ
jgi:hypothetical protein